ncbi:MAG TPA: 50S ribosomal protein L15 [Lentisphaeria bacterium]|nr:MAG: 50S ribosomal protein L15 [Lentisphaerae bacterium GWF2_38_69]HBM16294.1 50S ribosomal protein L15 [Lentisphaeria bacterium]
MKLHSLKNTEGAKHRRKRVGRGDASGWGKTAGRGDKGQHSRSGSGFRPYFEGGQITLFRRLPKRGFKSLNPVVYTVVNVSNLDKAFNANDTIDKALLLSKNLIHKTKLELKILGTGEITKPLTIKANVFSATAKAKIEAAGGKCEVVK